MKIYRRVEHNMERLDKKSDSLVHVEYISGVVSRVPRDTRNLVGKRQDHLVRLNSTGRPIVNKYREGKVKRTPNRGVK